MYGKSSKSTPEEEEFGPGFKPDKFKKDVGNRKQTGSRLKKGS